MLFKSLPIVRVRFPAGDTLPDAARRYAVDTITLGWEERLRARARRRSASGCEFATALPRGTVLTAGDRLVLDDAQLVVEVRAQFEPVFVVRPASPMEWALFGYQIGNSHQPIMICSDAIVCAALPGMEQVLKYHGIPFVADERVFTPVAQLPDHRHSASA